MHLLGHIERFLRRSQTPAARFGREALGDPRFVFDLRRGRQVGRRTEARILAFISEQDLKGGQPDATIGK